MRSKLPRFEPVGLAESREFWRKYRGNRDVERLLLEIAYTREVMADLSGYFDRVRDSWRAENLGHLVCMEKMRLLFVDHNLRQTALAGLPPARRKGEPDEPEPALAE